MSLHRPATGPLWTCEACTATHVAGKIHKRPDGKREWCNGVHTPVRNEAGELLRWAYEHLARLEVEKRYAEIVELLKPVKSAVELA